MAHRFPLLRTLALLLLASACDTEPRRDDTSSTSRAEGGESDKSSGGSSSDAGASATRDAAEASHADASAPSSGATSLSGNAAANGGCWKLPAVDRVRLYPAAGKAGALAQGKIEGSNTSAMNDFVEVAQVMSAPADGHWVELRVANPVAYRYLKYYGPKGSYGALAEVEFYAGDQRLTGKGFGSAGSRDNAGNVFDKALDGNLDSYFEGPLSDDNYVGLDLAADHLLAPPTFSPGAGSYATPQSVAIAAAPDAQIFYTTDGRDPRTAGMPYTDPIKVDVGGTLLRAVASKPCMQASDVAQELYQVGGAARTVQSSMHVGNSLTDTIVDFLQPVAKRGGITLDFNRYTIPGAGTWLYAQNPSGGFGVPNVQEALRTRRFDHLSMQPYPNMPCQVKASADGNDSDSGFIQQAWSDARAQNPSVQLWIYHQWPAPQDFKNCLSGGGWLRSDWRPSAPATWEDAVKNELSYHEAVRAELVRLHPSAPPPYIIPAGSALVALKRRVEAGQAPGLNNFFAQIFLANGTDIHLTKPGAYLVTLVFYACMFQKSPEGTQPDPSWGVSAELAKVMQQIAWQTVTSYPLSGVSR